MLHKLTSASDHAKLPLKCLPVTAVWRRAGEAEGGTGGLEREKSVLEALQDLGTHFGDRTNLSAAADAVDAAVAESAADDGGLGPPRQRIGKVPSRVLRTPFPIVSDPPPPPSHPSYEIL